MKEAEGEQGFLFGLKVSINYSSTPLFSGYFILSPLAFSLIFSFFFFISKLLV